MSLSFSTWAIRNPIPPLVLFLVLTIAGVISYYRMPVNNSPNIVIPIISVTVALPGASPNEIETQVTRRIESAISGVNGVKHVSSNISEGASVTTIEFHLETNFDRAMNDTRDAVSNIRDQLPRSILEPNVQRLEVDGGPILIFSIEATEMSLEEVSWFVDDTLSRELHAISGVAGVQRSGGINQEITITLDAAKITAFGISAAEVSRQLAQTNIDLPGGRLNFEGREFSLRTLGGAKTVEALRQLFLYGSGGRQIRLGDIATINNGGGEIRSITKIDGKPAVTFSVFRTKSSSEVTVGKKVDKKLEEMQKANPSLKFRKIFSLVAFTEICFDSAKYTFIEGTLLTILVVFLFLKDMRATLLAAITIPLSIIPTFAVIYTLGFSLNFISLLAISLVTGVLVDDAIVEIENIHRYLLKGKSPYDAALIAADEIALAVVATTLVICAVFVPVSFMKGIAGQYFLQFGVTVSVAAFFSLVVARLLTPMIAAYTFKPIPMHQEKEGYWKKKYHTLIAWTLNNRFKTLAIAFLLTVSSISLGKFIPGGFVPYEDLSQSSLTIELPRGSTIEQTEQVAQQINTMLKKHPEVEYVLTNTGGDSQGMKNLLAGSGASAVNKSNLNIKLVPPNHRKFSQSEFENMVLPELKQIPDIQVNFSNAAGAKDIMIALVSDDAEALTASAELIERDMRRLPGISSVGTSTSSVNPELTIIPDFAKAAEMGVTVQTLSDVITIATIGDIDSNLAKFNYGNRQLPIRVKLDNTKNFSLDTIKNLPVPTLQGTSIPLSVVTDIHLGFGPTNIEHYDRQRKITLQANVNGIALQDAINQIYSLPSIKKLPPQVKVKNTGDAEVMEEVNIGFAIAISAGILMVYVIQVLLYQDWLQPLTRLAALPLSISGVFVILLVTNAEFNLPTSIGILMLMGIADKNSILLVDYMLDRINAGVPRREAIMDAALIRARPIIMTSIAMLSGMLPIAIGIGYDTAFRAPMAIAVIGGLISSTALSLIFVPALFDCVRDFEEWLTPKLKKLIN